MNRIETRWLGFGLTGNQLDQFIFQTSTKIDLLWEAQYRKTLRAGIGLSAYREVVSRTGYFAQNVIARCFMWSDSEEVERRDIGRKIIIHHTLNSIIKAIDRVRAHYPELRIDEDELLERGIETGLELSSRLWEEKRNISPGGRLDSITYHEGERMIAERLGVQVMELRTGRIKEFVAFLDEFAQQNGRLPTPKEVELGVYGPSWEIETLRRVPFFSVGVDAKEIGSHRREPLVAEYGYPYVSPEDEVERNERRRIVEMVVNGNRLTGREREILARMFIDGLNQTELADELGVTRQEISRRILNILHKLENDQGIKGYKKSSEAEETMPPEQVWLNSVVNAIHFGDTQKTEDYLSKAEEIVASRLVERARRSGYFIAEDKIIEYVRARDFPPVKDSDVDTLRFMQKRVTKSQIPTGRLPR